MQRRPCASESLAAQGIPHEYRTARTAANEANGYQDGYRMIMVFRLSIPCGMACRVGSRAPVSCVAATTIQVDETLSPDGADGCGDDAIGEVERARAGVQHNACDEALAKLVA